MIPDTGAVVRLAGITFNDGADGDGDEFYCSTLDGWDGGAVTLNVVEKPLADGGHVAYGRRQAWELTMSGWVVAGPEGIGPARRKLSAALYPLLDTPGSLEVEEDDDTYTMSVYMSSGVRSRQQGPVAISFEVSLVAPDATKTIVES